MNATLRPLARFKSAPEHFVVRETLSFQPSGSGDHLYLRVRKRGVNTTDVAARLARQIGVPTRDVGYAGMKDKWAVAEQWFSVPGRDICSESLGEEVCVLEQVAHEKKLRRGAVACNEFEVTLTGVSDVPEIAEAVFPNYFGPQRLGRDNVARAKTWLLNRRRRRLSAFKQGLYLSVMRSVMFNKVLDARVSAESWREAIDGDVLNDDGFATAPLWGRGRSATSGAAAEIEAAALAAYDKILDALEHAGVTQDRRALVARADSLDVQTLAADSLRLSFRLSAGSFATVFLAQHFTLTDASIDQTEQAPS